MKYLALLIFLTVVITAAFYHSVLLGMILTGTVFVYAVLDANS